MDEILTLFSQQKQQNESSLSAALDAKQEELIASFGGLTNMIELCLTHQAASKNIITGSNQLNIYVKKHT